MGTFLAEMIKGNNCCVGRMDERTQDWMKYKNCFEQIILYDDWIKFDLMT